MIYYDSKSQMKVTLVDLSKVTTYLENIGGTGYHISDIEKTEKFIGRLDICTLNQLKNYKTSRCDDITSLFLMMVKVLNNNKLVGKKKYTKDASHSIEDAIKYLGHYDENRIILFAKYSNQLA